MPRHARTKPITVAVVTVGRSDYGILRPLLACIHKAARLRLRVLVCGSHLVREFGSTIQQVRQDGWRDIEALPMLVASDEPVGIGLSMGLGLAAFSRSFAARRPDFLVVLGDRFETFSAAAAAVPFNIPILHLHGGELTEGAMDDSFRHAITKMSHLHCVATPAYRRRVIQLGEEPWRVTVTGALSLDGLDRLKVLSRPAMEKRFGIQLATPPLLVTFHPVTREPASAEEQSEALFRALAQTNHPMVFTLPNADTHGRRIIEKIHQFIARRSDAWLVGNFGREAYFSMLKYAAAMVGNSSSGLLEAPSFGLPVVNVGNRQKGRIRGANVVDVDPVAGDIREGIQQALAPEFRRQIAGAANPYKQGEAAPQIVALLNRPPPIPRLLAKHFHDLAPPASERNA